MPGAAALVIRSATQVTAEVLDAGRDLVVVGRAGIGLDNVDVEAATRHGVMVVNAPQSNVLSAAEHTIALLLVAGPQHPPGRRATSRAASGTAAAGRASSCNGKTLGIVGLGRVGVLVAQRALAFGMQLVAYDPFVSAERARQLGVQLVDVARGARAPRRLPHRPPAEDPRHDRADRSRAARRTPSRRCAS